MRPRGRTLVPLLAVVLLTSCGSSQQAGPVLTGYGATRTDFAKGKEAAPGEKDDCCFLPKQADGSFRYLDAAYDKQSDDRVLTYAMSFVPRIGIAKAQKVVLDQLPRDAKLVVTANRRECKSMEYKSTLLQGVVNGAPSDVSVAFYSSPVRGRPFDGVHVTEIRFAAQMPSDHPIPC